MNIALTRILPRRRVSAGNDHLPVLDKPFLPVCLLICLSACLSLSEPVCCACASERLVSDMLPATMPSSEMVVVEKQPFSPVDM